MTPEQAAQLRAPFPESEVGKLPKVTCTACSKAATRNCDRHKKAQCAVCGNYLTTQHVHLDYVGHAAVTARLLAVDPAWTWEPVAYDEHGQPVLDRNGGMWIRLTIGDVTRLGYGDAAGKTGGNAVKELIGDAIRNAAMRFGVAVDLWHKGTLSGAVEPTSGAADEPAPVAARLEQPELEGGTPDEPAPRTIIRRDTNRAVQHDFDRPAEPEQPHTVQHIVTSSADATPQQIRLMSSLMTGRQLDDDQQDALILEHSGSRTTSRKELTRTEASALIDHLKGTP